MKKHNFNADKNKLEKISAGNGKKELSKKKIFKETGRIIANPLLYKDYDYFNDN